MERDVLKVSSKTMPGAVAGAIAGIVRDGRSVEIQAIGAGAVNQTMKAIAIARGFLAPSGINAVAIPAFTNVELEPGNVKTAMIIVVEDR